MDDIPHRDADAVIPETPGSPFPLITEYCDIIDGFGRGSSELGIPTANVDTKQLPSIVNDELEYGVYFGYGRLRPLDQESTIEKREHKQNDKIEYNYGSCLNREKGDLDVLPIVLSIGKNPFYKNVDKTVEIHIIHDFKENFYGSQIKFIIMGYIRPELDYTTKEALINDINTDIYITKKVLAKPGYVHGYKLI